MSDFWTASVRCTCVYKIVYNVTWYKSSLNKVYGLVGQRSYSTLNSPLVKVIPSVPSFVSANTSKVLLL